MKRREGTFENVTEAEAEAALNPDMKTGRYLK